MFSNAAHSGQDDRLEAYPTLFLERRAMEQGGVFLVPWITVFVRNRLLRIVPGSSSYSEIFPGLGSDDALPIIR